MNATQSLWPGWETVQLIGRGSFGAVYEIQRKLFEDDTEVEKAALKVISIPQNDSDIEELYNDGYDEASVTSTFHSHLKSIVSEYSLMRKMNGSSNVVNCDDVRYVPHDDGIGWDIYIKMELLTPLAKALPAAISEAQVIKIAKDMCAALDLCSKHNIIHRDIKPQNIFISENGDYKLGDFGIAKTVEKTMGGTKTGTYKYMAPEVYNNQPYNSTADVYSLGLVLYWLLNERRMPFMPLPPASLKIGADEESRYRRMSGEQLPAPKGGNTELQRIVLKACAFDPKDRYQSALEMREDLRRLSTGTLHQEIEQSAEFADGPTVGPVFEQNTPTGNQYKPANPVSAQSIPSNVTSSEGGSFSAESVQKDTPKKKKSKVTLLLAIVAGLILLGLAFFTLNSKEPTSPALQETETIPPHTVPAQQSSVCVAKASREVSSGKITISWSAVDGAVEYQVYRATSADGSYEQVTTTTGTSFTNASAEVSKTYYYKVRSVSNDDTKSDWSNIVSETCALPQPVVTVANEASSGKAKLTWTAVEGAEEYKIYSSTSKNGDYKLIKTTPNTSCTNISAKAGESYYYKVMAVHSTKAANSAYSEVVSRTCDLPQPVVTVANEASSGKIKLTWAAIEGAKEYKVYTATSKNGEYKLIKTTPNTSCTNTSAKAGESYYYKVIAIHSTKAANSAYSEVVSRTCDLPQPKVSLKLLYEGVKVSWGKVSGAKEYKIYRSDTKNGEYKLLKTVTGTSYTDTSVLYTETYHYKVRAIHSTDAASSAYSDISSIRVK